MSAINRVKGGVQGERAGRAFEDHLQAAHQAYAAYGIAYVQRMPVPTAPRGGGQLRVLTARQGYDFVGTFGPNAGPEIDPGAYHGRAIAMEAKRSSGAMASLPIVPKDKQGFGIKEHQLKSLAVAYRDFGAVAVIVWRNGETGLFLPPDALLSAWERWEREEIKRIPRGEFLKYEFDVAFPRYARVEDWLYPVRCWLEERGAPSHALSPRKTYRMITYSINPIKKAVVVWNGTQVVREIPCEHPDRAMIERAARESETIDQFAKAVEGTKLVTD